MWERQNYGLWYDSDIQKKDGCKQIQMPKGNKRDRERQARRHSDVK